MMREEFLAVLMRNSELYLYWIYIAVNICTVYKLANHYTKTYISIVYVWA